VRICAAALETSQASGQHYIQLKDILLLLFITEQNKHINVKQTKKIELVAFVLFLVYKGIME
jgi:hypothetical protein